mmetsp:Transcript_36512/g.51611  ORF Transcript_36512/g.51611 Transcript_36512/m.51611 type:complete len:85 (+) Transcript_36512:975-1229(+)
MGDRKGEFRIQGRRAGLRKTEPHETKRSPAGSVGPIENGQPIELLVTLKNKKQEARSKNQTSMCCHATSIMGKVSCFGRERDYE